MPPVSDIISRVSVNMAKLRKQKKSGMLKRQQQKRHNKMVRRRKAMPKRKPQQQNSSQLEQLLSVLPTLAFEPELIDLKMDTGKLSELLESEQTEVDMLLALMSEEFISEIDQKLAMLEVAHSETSVKSLLAKATRHQIAESNDKITHLSNPLLVAVFLKTRSAVEGHQLDLDSLPSAIKEFEKRNHDYIQNLTEQTQTAEKDELKTTAEEDLQADVEEEPRVPSIEEDVYKKFIELVPAEKQERIEEDLDVFLTDFQPPHVSEWDLSMIKHFLEKWFVENANPFQEDLDSMRESLLKLFQFLDEEKLLTNNFLEQVPAYLQKPK
jgi:flavodoxin